MSFFFSQISEDNQLRKNEMGLCGALNVVKDFC